jgi:SAM-dependent methyltransferase
MDGDRVFGGSIPEVYDECMVPMLFAPYASDLAVRLEGLGQGPVLEIAAGTGVLTRELATRLPESVAITATDLNQPMLDHGAAHGTVRPVEWKQADVMRLPFADATFETVVCQFGVMFFPHRPSAYAEVRRVLRPGGSFVFNAWESLAENDFARIVSAAVGELFPEDPPSFVDRVPYGYHDVALIEADLAAGGYAGTVTFEKLALRSRAASAAVPATGFCQGTPLRNEITARDETRLDEATAAAAAAVAREFGQVDVAATMSAHIVTARP